MRWYVRRWLKARVKRAMKEAVMTTDELEALAAVSCEEMEDHGIVEDCCGCKGKGWVVKAGFCGILRQVECPACNGVGIRVVKASDCIETAKLRIA